jgi:branched-subunit amino acid transport protein
MPAFRTASSDTGVLPLPLRSQQSPSSFSDLLGFVCVAALAAAVLIPLFGLTIYGLADPNVRIEVARHPFVAFEIATALLLWTLIFAWPLKRQFARLTLRRTIEVGSDAVTGEERGPFTTANWTESLANYRGIAHHVRSSLSGTRHEIVLVHPRAKRNVVLSTAEHISDADMVRMATLLRLPQIPTRALYARGWQTADPMLTGGRESLATAA